MLVGDKVFTSAGEALVLDIKEKYLILFRLSGREFVKANNYSTHQGELVWGHGNYYSSLADLMQDFK